MVVNGDVRGTIPISPSSVIGSILALPKVCHATFQDNWQIVCVALRLASAQDDLNKRITINGAIDFQGFAAGSSGGVVTICEREQDDRLFKKVKQLTIDGPAQNVHHMTLSPAEDMLIASMDNNQMYSLNLTVNEEVDAYVCKLSIGT